MGMIPQAGGPAEYEKTGFYIAARDGDLAAVLASLEKYPEFVHLKWGGTPVLCAAAKEHRADVVRLLIEMGADVNVAEDDGWTVLAGALLALIGADTVDETVKLLIDAGARVDPRAAMHLSMIEENRQRAIRQQAPAGNSSRKSGCLTTVVALTVIVVTIAVAIWGLVGA